MVLETAELGQTYQGLTHFHIQHIWTHVAVGDVTLPSDVGGTWYLF